MSIEQKQHSRLGIASFVLSLPVLPLFFGGIRYLLFSYSMLFCMLLAPLMALVAVILGIVGLIQTKRKKVFAWMGLVLSTISLLITVLFLIRFVNNFTWR